MELQPPCRREEKLVRSGVIIARYQRASPAPTFSPNAFPANHETTTTLPEYASSSMSPDPSRLWANKKSEYAMQEQEVHRVHPSLEFFCTSWLPFHTSTVGNVTEVQNPRSNENMFTPAHSLSMLWLSLYACLFCAQPSTLFLQLSFLSIRVCRCPLFSCLSSSSSLGLYVPFSYTRDEKISRGFQGDSHRSL